MYKFIIVGGPASDYIQRCLNSIVNQSHSDWEAVVVLDPVGDGTYEKAQHFKSDKIRVIQNDTQMFALPNILKCIEMLDPKDDDVLITVDADDWLNGPDALSIVHKYYTMDPDLLMTYGSWQQYPNQFAPTNNGAHSGLDFMVGIRKVPFRASHLRTFKYKLWSRILDKDLRDPLGNYYKVAWDCAFMWPMLEMAGVSRSRYIPEILYNYNKETPFNDSKVRLLEQMLFTDYIAAREPYKYVGGL